MFKLFAMIALSAIILGGCSTQVVRDGDVVIVDPEKLDEQINGIVDYVPTPDHVVVGEKDGIVIEVQKREVENDEQLGVKLQVWEATAMNTTDNDKCVTPLWRLMDFEYISDGASEQLIRSYGMVHLGQMRQRVWILDGIPVAPPPSGYLVDLRVRKTIPNARPGEECNYLVDENEVEEK